VKQNFIGVKCPDCKDGDLVEKKARKGNTFFGCSNYPKCKFTSANKPLAEKCPSCGSEFLVEKNLKAGAVIACPNKECDYEREAPPPVAGAAEAGAPKVEQSLLSMERRAPSPVELWAACVFPSTRAWTGGGAHPSIVNLILC
jgi:DNA topoisomerase-1